MEYVVTVLTFSICGGIFFLLSREALGKNGGAVSHGKLASVFCMFMISGIFCGSFFYGSFLPLGPQFTKLFQVGFFYCAGFILYGLICLILLLILGLFFQRDACESNLRRPLEKSDGGVGTGFVFHAAKVSRTILDDQSGHLSLACSESPQGQRQRSEEPYFPVDDGKNPATSHGRSLILSRRTFLRWSSVAALSSVAYSLAEATSRGMSDPVTENSRFFHPSLRGLREPLNIVFVSDLHFGRYLDSKDLEQLVMRINGLGAKLLVLGGDIFHCRQSPMEEGAEILKNLAPCLFGKYAVLGNHEMLAGEQRSVNCLQRSGFVVLRDQWITFEAFGQTIHLGGVNDPAGNPFRSKSYLGLGRFLDAAPDGPGIRCLVSHRPDVFPAISSFPVELVLAAHVHGAEVILPLPFLHNRLFLDPLVNPFQAGWHQAGGRHMFVTRGCSGSLVPWRGDAPPEIAVLTICCGQEPSFEQMNSG
jgi:uncharacterized protein